MLTVAEDTLRQLAAQHSKQVATHLYGQEINAETYAICKADLLLKGENRIWLPMPNQCQAPREF